MKKEEQGMKERRLGMVIIILILVGCIGIIAWHNVWGYKMGRGPFINLEEKERDWLIYDVFLIPKTKEFRIAYRDLPTGKFFLPRSSADIDLDWMVRETSLITGSISTFDFSGLTEIPGFEGEVQVDTASLEENFLPYFLYQLDLKEEWWEIPVPSRLNILHTGRVTVTIYKEV